MVNWYWTSQLHHRSERSCFIIGNIYKARIEQEKKVSKDIVADNIYGLYNENNDDPTAKLNKGVSEQDLLNRSNAVR